MGLRFTLQLAPQPFVVHTVRCICTEGRAVFTSTCSWCHGRGVTQAITILHPRWLSGEWWR